MVNTAWAYAITGDAKYAQRAREVLVGYAQRYREYPYHSASRTRDGWALRSGGHLYEQTLSEASAFAGTIAPAYDLIYDWDGISAADHALIRNGLVLPLLQNTAQSRRQEQLADLAQRSFHLGRGAAG